ncbi:SDR family oxidoreductase [Kitasatospora sp. NPDC088779]|uniref:SDR family oxidoreductase n=1 Tax=Kitasatospora sp. NPDC088779 TaxID=3154964 RepID=UPI0034453D6F
MSILFTGATGFLGCRVLRRLLDEGNGAVITILGRADTLTLRQRVEAAVLAAEPDPPPAGSLGRLRYVEGDLTKPSLGLGRREIAAAADGLTSIWHCAGLLALVGDPAPLFRTNILGTRGLLELADQAPQAHLFHTSTAYVAGRRSGGHILEDDLSEEAGFQTYYEESKFNGERLVRRWAAHTGRSVTIMRPSLLVLDQVIPDGLPNQTLGILARLIDVSLGADAQARPGGDGALRVRIRSNPEDSLNMLQVDYAAHAMVRVAAHRPTGLRTVHVTHPQNTSMSVFLRAFELAYPGLAVETVPALHAPIPVEVLAATQLAQVSSFMTQSRTYGRANLLATVGDLPDPAPVDSAYLARGMRRAGSVVGV